MTRRPLPSRCQGFTLIEMLVVLGIIGMTMTLAPAIISSVDGSRLRAAANELVTRLRETRSQAMRQDTVTEVVLDIGRRGYASSILPGFQTLPAIVDAIEVKPDGLLEPGGLARIRFSPGGTASQARIALGHGSGAQVITVDWLTGRVRNGE